MPIAQALLPEFDQEMATTRRVLERVPADRADWKPHEKSTSMGNLAAHLATLPSMVVRTLSGAEMNIIPQGQQSYTPPRMTSSAELLETFDRNVREGRAALEAASDEELSQPWSLKAGERTLFTLPRAAVLRTMLLSHIIHHRGQMTVYLRLNDVPVPSVYGPTADEQM